MFHVHCCRSWITPKKERIFLPVSCLTSLLHFLHWLFHTWHDMSHVHAVLAFNVSYCMFDLRHCMFYMIFIHVNFTLHVWHPYCMFDVGCFRFNVKCCMFTWFSFLTLLLHIWPKMLHVLRDLFICKFDVECLTSHVACFM